MKINPLSPRWQHKDPRVRLQAVLSQKLDQPELAQLARQDEALEVRLGAIDALTSEALLLELAESAEVQSTESGHNFDLHPVAQQAYQRWIELLGEDLGKLSLINDSLPQNLLLAIARRSSQDDFRRTAANLIVDAQDRETLLLEKNHTRVHQLLVTKIEDEATLEKLQLHFQDKDKNVHRIVRGKLQAIKLERERRETLEQEIGHLQASSERLVQQLDLTTNQVIDPECPRRLALLKQALAELIANHPEFRERLSLIEANLHSCQQQLDNAPDPDLVARQAAEAQLAVSLDQLQQLDSAIRSGGIQSAEANQRLHSIRESLTAQAIRNPAVEQITAHLDTISPYIETWLAWDQLRSKPEKKVETQLQKLQNLSWPDTYPVPASYTENIENLGQKIARQAATRENQATLEGEFETLLAKLARQIEAGQVKPANRTLAQLKKRQGPLGTGKFNASLSSLTAKLLELKDWQGFATLPKRESLCEQMTTLAEDTAISPKEKALAIKELQEQWKKLGASDSPEAQKLWKRFKQQGDIAYEPCAKYFEKQHEQRLLRLGEREALCAKLELLPASLEETHPIDFKLLQSEIHAAEDFWRKTQDIPRNRRNGIQKRFDKAIAPLQALIAAEHDKNEALKLAMIEDMTSMLADDQPVPALVEHAKQLQRKWREVGITERRRDQKLWKNFRRVCDEVFTRRDTVVEQRKVEEKQSSEQGQQVCAEFAAKLESDQPIKSGDIQQFKAATSELEGLRQNKSLQRQIDGLVKKARAIIAQQVESGRRQQLVEIQRLGELCDQQEESGSSIDDEGWESDIVLDATILDRLTARRNGQATADPKRAEELVIRLEILAGLPSPAESQNARMAWQVERLNRELSRGEKETRSVPEQVRDIVIDWHTLPGKSATLHPRFVHALSKLGAA